MADVTGVPVVRSTTTEATCLGAGILAATAVGWYSDSFQAAAAMTDVADRFTPNLENQQIYNRLYIEVYQKLFPTLQPLLNHLTTLTNNEP
jgi:xylulokinase